MHTVVHLPTFAHEFEACVLAGSCNRSWAALYYAILAHTLYHVEGSSLLANEMQSHAGANLTRTLLDKSIDLLFQGSFMSDHRITSIQAISTTNGTGRKRSDQELAEREIQKRIWWFLVRYDWLQIPFQNICQIHPTQFTTPMPLNCFDEPERMIRDGMVVTQSDRVPTSTRWTVTMDQVSVLVWKHQDRINAGNSQGEVPMPGLLLLCTAHKILGVHRHFQLLSFRDRRFAFTQMSCLAIVERALTAIQAWPDTTETRIARRMWTTLTQVVSCSVNLVFALVFKDENTLMYDASKIRNLLSFTKDFLQREEHVSSIAARGVKLIGALADLERWSEGPKDIEEEMGRIVRQFAASDGRGHGMVQAEAQQIVFPPLSQDVWDIFNTGGSAFSEYLMDQDFHI
ncbi:hypothetical protein HYQ45_003477 [Verticillium longisporum]|uniref:Transcription factor domain-containing protein n=1 Tax=Verticillium longisporum TaxID=100787 RepID=A0A8I2ZWQ6_VERLO|nr:hypothetical protein HYQ45_003477 [Verticillium longisporum]